MIQALRLDSIHVEPSIFSWTLAGSLRDHPRLSPNRTQYILPEIRIVFSTWYASGIFF